MQKHQRGKAATDGVDWAEVRANFNLQPDWADFTSFMLSSHPKPVREAIAELAARIDARPEWAELAALEPGEANMIFQVKSAIARYVGARPDEFALVQSTTAGLGLLYAGLQLHPGDEILLSEHDHYSHHEAARRKAEKCGAATRFVSLYEDGAAVTEDELIDRVLGALTGRTRVVGLTWVYSGSGVRMPVRKAADAIRSWYGARPSPLIVVDGVHGCGVLDEPVDGLGADFFVSGVHKWLHGPRGTGFIWGTTASWRYVEPTIPTFEIDADVFGAWVGRSRLPPTRASFVSPGGFVAYEYLYAVPAAIDFLTSIGKTEISRRVLSLNTRLREGLAALPGVRLITPLPEHMSAGIVCFEVDGLEPREVVAGLAARHIRSATTPYLRSYARFAATIENSESDVDHAIDAVAGLSHPPGHGPPRSRDLGHD
ncbi:aminotransferase class V-fold PLP-dependent enzyme [Streptomyces sp. NPDC018029]|uniref:aminotransferase class V-fold PLP-dependent enzyme n=1 Tax=Streptomyces sp. NPDC018029 TaxID=3365032 RepID=UPI0037B0CDFB